jgi:hypothetical protein
VSEKVSSQPSRVSCAAPSFIRITVPICGAVRGGGGGGRA